MIDYEKKAPGRKELLTAGAVAVAVLLAAAGVRLMDGAGAKQAEEPAETASYAATTVDTETASYVATTADTETASYAAATVDTETAVYAEMATDAGLTADDEKAEHVSSSMSAAYRKLYQDGTYAANVLMPAGSGTFTRKELILVNPWHLLPENYEADLENVEYGHRMDACAAEHLRDMLADCRAAGYAPLVCSSYRDRSKQEGLFASDVRRFMYRGYSEEEAIEETAKNVAVPGSSEHEAGLAADIVYAGRQVLDESQELNETQQWLMEHCWEYGFILRYPRDKQEITGITYEPWHYRYVGMEAAEKIMSRGICLEEYLGVIDADR